MKYLRGIFLILILTGCADSVSLSEAIEMQPVGFWHGLWHGAIVPFSWFISLFSEDVAIYAIYNNDGWYNFGFVLGVGTIVGGGR
jgi:hypothetical protein